MNRCEAYGCVDRAEWECEGQHLCGAHTHAWHVKGDRTDFADEYASQDRLERQREARERFR